MTSGRNETMGRIIARAWMDSGFKKRLLADPAAALLELGFALPAGKSVIAVENIPTLTHLVLTSPRYTETRSAYSDIKEFGESYRDPRLFPLNWGSHDPVFTARIRADAKAALRYLGVDVPDGMEIRVVENSTSRAHLVLPTRPDDAELASGIADRVADGMVPPAMRYARMLGWASYRQFF